MINSKSYRIIQKILDKEMDADNIIIKFHNNKIIESSDTSFEACVKYILHKLKQLDVY